MTLASEPDEPIVRQGTSGIKIDASSNWVYLATDPEKIVFEYSVDFKPAIDSFNLRSQLLNSQREKIGNVKSFDGAKLWLPIMLPQKVRLFIAYNKF